MLEVAHRCPAESFGELFRRVQRQFQEAHQAGNLACKSGCYKDCAVLKLQKSHWTNDPMDRVENDTGIFFSIWVDAQAAQAKRANYNVHALRLRTLAGYRIASREFAEEFREQFACYRVAWPNVRVDYGPQTLMRGWIDLPRDGEEQEAFELLERFGPLSGVIDRMLQERRR